MPDVVVKKVGFVFKKPCPGVLPFLYLPVFKKQTYFYQYRHYSCCFYIRHKKSHTIIKLTFYEKSWYNTPCFNGCNYDFILFAG